MHSFVLETERLRLRPMTVADAEAVFQWAGDPLVARYMVYPTYTRVEDVTEWLRSVEAQEDVYEFGFVRKSGGCAEREHHAQSQKRCAELFHDLSSYKFIIFCGTPARRLTDLPD